MILISVDLPAPFSPTSARTSPADTEKSTRSSDRTPGNDLEMALTSTTIRGLRETSGRWGGCRAYDDISPAEPTLLRIVGREGLGVVIRPEARRENQIHRLVEADIILGPHVSPDGGRFVALRHNDVRVHEVELRHRGA